MRALLDTCVLIDALQNREPFADAAKQLFLLAAAGQYTGCITAKSSTDVYYLTHRALHDDVLSREVLGKLFMLFSLLDTAGDDCRGALSSPVSDYEDAVMIRTAAREAVDCIVTRNTHDYRKSSVPVYTPDAFLAILEGN